MGWLNFNTFGNDNVLHYIKIYSALYSLYVGFVAHPRAA